MKTALLLIVSIFIFSSFVLKAQVINSKCIPRCNLISTNLSPYMNSRSFQQMRIMDGGSVFIGGWHYGGGGFVSIIDTLFEPEWNLEMPQYLIDSVIGIDTFIYKRRQMFRQSEKLSDNLFSCIAIVDTTKYELINGVQTYLGHASISSAFTLFDIFGNIRWTRNVGTNSNCYLTSIATSGNNLIYSGVLSNIYYLNPPSSGNQIIINVDTSGNLLWSKIINGSVLWNLKKTKGFFDSGYVIMSDDSTGIVLYKIDNSGIVQWSYKYSTGNILDGIDLTVGADSSLYILARSYSIPVSSVIIKIDSNGLITGSNSYSTTSNFNPIHIIEVSGGELKFLANSPSPGGNTVVELNPNGSVLNATIVFMNMAPLSMQSLEKQGNLYVGLLSGYIPGSPSWGYDWSFGKLFKTDEEFSNCEFAKFSTTVVQNNSIVNAITVSCIDSAISSNFVNYNMEYYPEVLLDSNACNSSVGLNDLSIHSLEIYPNPNSGTFTLKLTKNELIETFKLFDVQGKLVFEKIINEYADMSYIELPSSIPNGVFYYKLTTNNLHSGKMVLIR